MSPSAITLMSRAPVPGAVKTRLARATSADFACALHEAMSLDILEAISGTPVALRMLAVTGEASAKETFAGRARRIDPGLILTEQPEGDLGERMERALAEMRASGAEEALVVGSDCLEVVARIPRALGILASADALLWPAADGGFVLLGASRALPAGILTGLPWGTERALEATRAALEAARFSVALPDPPLPDVDDLEGVRALAARVLQGSSRGERTSRLLAGRRDAWE